MLIKRTFGTNIDEHNQSQVMVFYNAGHSSRQVRIGLVGVSANAQEEVTIRIGAGLAYPQEPTLRQNIARPPRGEGDIGGYSPVVVCECPPSHSVWLVVHRQSPGELRMTYTAR